MGKLLGYYLLIINAAGFLIMCVDKLLAKKEARRVPERTLLLIAAIGGSLGSLLGMLVAHHKTRKAKFYILVPLLLVLHAAAAGWYFLREIIDKRSPLPEQFRQRAFASFASIIVKRRFRPSRGS